MSVLMDNKIQKTSNQTWKFFEWEEKNREITQTPKARKLKTAMVALLSSALMFSSCGTKTDYEKASKDFIKAEKKMENAKKDLEKAEKNYEDALEEYKDAREDVKEEAEKL